MKSTALIALSLLVLAGCQQRSKQENKSSVTVPLPPAQAGNSADNVGENGETENNE